jgi:hypothetical protein
MQLARPDASDFIQCHRNPLFTPAPDRLFEYACHEGNYRLPDIVRITRGMEAGR